VSPARILVVCTANICRSPIAERLLAAYLGKSELEVDLEVSSAGTHARPGRQAADGMLRIAEEWGLELASHRSRRVEESLVTRQGLIITMEDAHRTVVSRLATGVGSRTFTMTELASLVDVAAPSSSGLSAAVAGWHAARARTSGDAPDVPDPYGGSAQDYETSAWQLARLVERIGPHLQRALDVS
jgi:protein-tyrosine phosphatase